LSTRARKGLIQCPHCNSHAIIRTSDIVTPLVKDLHLICLNPDCGHTWKAQIAAIYTLSPSSIPNPDISLPMAPKSTPRRRYPESARKAGSDPGDDPRQIPMFG
jgi:hypothetical protein